MTGLIEFTAGTGPILISVPHDGQEIPRTIRASMTAEGLGIPDTDWHVAELYRPLIKDGASLLKANLSRYVVDLNRPRDGSDLYGAEEETEVCPSTTFDGAPIYLPGLKPSGSDAVKRIDQFWEPYHRQLARELNRIRQIHGYALLWDAHSIRSRVPRFFDGQLPDFNIGTAEGRSCPDAVAKAVFAALPEAYTKVMDGRFKGGHITRAYGQPEHRTLALQMELSQKIYMDEDHPDAGLLEAAVEVRQVLGELLQIFTLAGSRWVRESS